ncbi:MAG: glutathione S-transferase family protein [Rhodospirillaceae bacterium]
MTGTHVLVGQYDSPFLRRVAVSMHYYGVPYERNVLSVFRNADQVADINPLIKVPVLILPDGEKIFDSLVILDYLDELAGPKNALTPPDGPRRRAVLRAATIGVGISEKCVALSIDKNLHANAPSLQWRHRVRHQIKLCLEWIEANASPEGPWYLGDDLTQADITVAAALDHLMLRHPGELDWDALPKTRGVYNRALALDCFKAVPLIEG